MQVSHLLQLVTKQLHYFYANQANKFNLSVYNIIKKEEKSILARLIARLLAYLFVCLKYNVRYR